MPKDTRVANGAAGKKDLLLFDPEDLVLVEDVASALYDERVKLEVDERLVLSIMVRGVLVPIVVRKNPETGKTEVVDGRQRTKACREANKRLRKEGRDYVRIPAVVKRSDAAESLAMMVTTNDLRTADSPLNRARKAARYLDLGGTEDDACVMLGVSRASLKNMLGLLDAPAAVRKAVEAGQITASDGYKLARLEPAEATKKLSQLRTEAPRDPGKKRSSNAAKAREIVTGKKPEIGSRRQQIENMLTTIESDERINENKRMGAVAALQWVLGDDKALDAIMDMPGILRTA